jgi:acetyl esterase/lipase
MLTRAIGLFFIAVLGARSEDVLDLKAPQIYLWPKGAPGSEGVTAKEQWLPSKDGFHRVTNVHNPSITVFLPPKIKATGAAFVICPGGGHSHLAMDLEGSQVAERLNRMGIAAFVLKSRLAKTEGYHYEVEVHSLQDAQRALRLVRSRAKEWNVDPARVGIMGFSAGGGIAALIETRFDAGKPDAADPIDRLSSRPDFAVLGYPGLRGLQVTVAKDTPPTFIVVNNDDALAPFSTEYYIALKKAGVPAELHIYTKGGHGFGMTGRTPAFAQLPVSGWPDRLLEWMNQK